MQRHNFSTFALILSFCIVASNFAYSHEHLDLNVGTEITKLCSANKEINPKVLNLALQAYHKLNSMGLVKNPHLTVIDYTIPSNKKRMWIINMENKTIPFYTHVSHGKHSGGVKTTSFSNSRGSKQSSLGVYLTKQSYHAPKVGYSLQLDGLEKGFNDLSLPRGVIIHGAKYVNAQFIKQHARAGRSWGCPAVGTKMVKPIIDTIKDNSVVFAYYPDPKWLAKSKFVDIS